MTRGFAALGVEGVSKPRNAGAVIRTAHAFDAAFAFTVGEVLSQREIQQADTSKAMQQMPFYSFASYKDIALPKGCQLVGIEITDDATNLPSFRHPRAAAYILGSERIGLSDETIDLCHHIIKIPTKFSLNLAVAGAIVLYDRLTSMNNFPPRPVQAGGEKKIDAMPIFGEPLWVAKHARQKH